jgi:hypothetical protein
MRRSLLCLVPALFFLAGCSGDPATSRLSPGQEVITFDTDPGSRVVGATAPNRIEAVPVGTRVTVARDEGDATNPYRPVTVAIPGMDTALDVARIRLRPTR